MMPTRLGPKVGGCCASPWQARQAMKSCLPCAASAASAGAAMTLAASAAPRKRSLMSPSSRKVGDGLRRRIEAFVAIGLDLVGIERRETGKSDHLPGGLVAIAAIDRIGEEPLHGDVEQRIEELLR